MIVKIKPGCNHRVGPDQLAYAGDEIEVTEAEMASFGDKFVRLAEPEPEPKPEPEPAAKGRGARKR